MELLRCLVCQLTISFHTFLGMTFHAMGPRRDAQIFRAWEFFDCSCGNSGFKHGSVIVNNILAHFTLSLSAPQISMIKGMMLVLPNQLLCLVLSTSDQCFSFLSSQFDVIHIHR